jgi:hypothetical protein
VVPAPRQPFINERPQFEPEPEVVPIEVPKVEAAPPRRFAPLASIEPADEKPDVRPAESEPAYDDVVDDATPVRTTMRASAPDSGLPLEEDDLDVPAFIRRKVE